MYRPTAGGLCTNCNQRRVELEAIVPFLIARGEFAATFADWSARDRAILLDTTHADGDADAPTITCECGHEAPPDAIDGHTCEVTA